MFHSINIVSSRRYPFVEVVATLILLLGLSSCGTIQITFGAKETSTQTISTNTVLPTQTETKTAAPTTEPIPTQITPQVRPLLPTDQLSQSGPWFIYRSADGIKAANPDGSGSVLVSSRLLHFGCCAEESDIPNGISPTGTMFAHRINHEGGKGYDLELIRFPSLESEIVTPLISDENLAKMATDISADQNVGSAVIYDASIAWSPDGRYLAFSAALDGPSSDLYIYDSVSKRVRHLTSGSLEVAIPQWTPDSKQIIYQVVETFGTGAGWSTRGLWTINVDGSNEHRIFTAHEDSGPDIIEGFYESKMLVRHFTMGGDSLYLVDWKTGDATMLIPDVISAAIEPINGSYLFINSTGTLYFAPDTKTTFKPISSLLYTGGAIYWVDVPGRYIILSEGISEVDQFGNVSDLQGIPYNAEDWASNCLVTTGIDCTTPSGSFNIPDVQSPTLYWVPNASGFFYLSNDQLSYVSVADPTPVVIDNGVVNSNSRLPGFSNWLRNP